MVKTIQFACLGVLSLALMPGISCKSAQEKQQGQAGKKSYVRALYIPVRKSRDSRDLNFVRSLVERGKPLGINGIILDTQGYGGLTNKVNQEVVNYLKSEQIYTVARVVCFQGGIKKLPVSEDHLTKLKNLIEEVSQMGFDEVQLDYIRFEDAGIGYSLARKYGFLDEFIAGVREQTKRHGVKLSADIFGRIVYNQADGIGQNLENFAKHTDVIYPMLYPSHFTPDRKRTSNPGFTMAEGTEKALVRLQGKTTEVVPWVQVFVYNIQVARVSLTQYVVLQIEAVEKTAARGWAAWNAKGEYNELFQALEKINAAAATPAASATQ